MNIAVELDEWRGSHTLTDAERASLLKCVEWIVTADREERRAHVTHVDLASIRRLVESPQFFDTTASWIRATRQLLQLVDEYAAVTHDMKLESDAYQRGLADGRNEWMTRLRQTNIAIPRIGL